MSRRRRPSSRVDASIVSELDPKQDVPCTVVDGDAEQQGGHGSSATHSTTSDTRPSVFYSKIFGNIQRSTVGTHHEDYDNPSSSLMRFLFISCPLILISMAPLIFLLVFMNDKRPSGLFEIHGKTLRRTITQLPTPLAPLTDSLNYRAFHWLCLYVSLSAFALHAIVQEGAGAVATNNRSLQVASRWGILRSIPIVIWAHAVIVAGSLTHASVYINFAFNPDNAHRLHGLNVTIEHILLWGGIFIIIRSILSGRCLQEKRWKPLRARLSTYASIVLVLQLVFLFHYAALAINTWETGFYSKNASKTNDAMYTPLYTDSLGYQLRNLSMTMEDPGPQALLNNPTRCCVNPGNATQPSQGRPQLIMITWLLSTTVVHECVIRQLIIFLLMLLFYSTTDYTSSYKHQLSEALKRPESPEPAESPASDDISTNDGRGAPLLAPTSTLNLSMCLGIASTMVATFPIATSINSWFQSFGSDEIDAERYFNHVVGLLVQVFYIHMACVVAHILVLFVDHFRFPIQTFTVLLYAIHGGDNDGAALKDLANHLGTYENCALVYFRDVTELQKDHQLQPEYLNLADGILLFVSEDYAEIINDWDGQVDQSKDQWKMRLGEEYHSFVRPRRHVKPLVLLTHEDTFDFKGPLQDRFPDAKYLKVAEEANVVKAIEEKCDINLKSHAKTSDQHSRFTVCSRTPPWVRFCSSLLSFDLFVGLRLCLFLAPWCAVLLIVRSKQVSRSVGNITRIDYPRPSLNVSDTSRLPIEETLNFSLFYWSFEWFALTTVMFHALLRIPDVIGSEFKADNCKRRGRNALYYGHVATVGSLLVFGSVRYTSTELAPVFVWMHLFLLGALVAALECHRLLQAKGLKLQTGAICIMHQQKMFAERRFHVIIGMPVLLLQLAFFWNYWAAVIDSLETVNTDGILYSPYFPKDWEGIEYNTVTVDYLVWMRGLGWSAIFVCGQASQLFLLIGVHTSLQTGDHGMSLFDSVVAVTILCLQLASCIITIFLPATAARGWLSLGESQTVIDRCVVGFYIACYLSIIAISGMLLWQYRQCSSEADSNEKKSGQAKIHILYDTLDRKLERQVEKLKTKIKEKTSTERQLVYAEVEFFGLEAKLKAGPRSPFVAQNDIAIIILSQTYVNRVSGRGPCGAEDSCFQDLRHWYDHLRRGFAKRPTEGSAHCKDVTIWVQATALRDTEDSRSDPQSEQSGRIVPIPTLQGVAKFLFPAAQTPIETQDHLINKLTLLLMPNALDSCSSI
eukprot:m.7305 g.7305  ORF g.7305 m.7305 type:complete len:1251 (+) comp8798_c0_seq1:98-3850(+)